MSKQGAGNGAIVCVGAIVGAGFASGREIMSFFSRFGIFSWLGIGLAAAAMGFLCLFVMGVANACGADSLVMICQKRMGKFAFLGQGAFALLLCATGGSMLCAAGELAALTVPVYYAYEIGMGLTLVLGFLLIRKDLRALFVASKMLIPLLIGAFVLCYFVKGEPMPNHFDMHTLLGPLSYGAMNIALCVPVLCEVGKGCTKEHQQRMALCTGLVIFTLLAIGNGALLHQRGMTGEPLPMVKILREFGLFGFYLCAVMMYLAVFSTLLTCLRGLYKMNPWACLSVALVALIGFEKLVGTIYPILGYGCVILMASWRKRVV